MAPIEKNFNQKRKCDMRKEALFNWTVLFIA